MLAAVLESSGHDVLVAADGLAGLALVEAERPDVAIIDIGLPGIDGYELARRVRAGAHDSDAGPRVALVALTGYGQPDDVQRARDVGFDRHIVKPVDGAVLEAVVRGLALQRSAIGRPRDGGPDDEVRAPGHSGG